MLTLGDTLIWLVLTDFRRHLLAWLLSSYRYVHIASTEEAPCKASWVLFMKAE